MQIIFFILTGAIFGSFSNVIIYRLPRILNGEAMSLSWPGSHCPGCKQPVKVYHNIPLLGWLLLRGRCAGCGQAISLRYPLVEAVMAILYGTIIWQQGVTPQSIVDLFVVTLLVPLFFIDLQTMLLPDRLTLPLLVVALLFAASGYGAVTLPQALIAAGLGFGIPWLLSLLFRLLRGHEGMGRGDMKLLAGLGAWVGPLPLLDIVTASSLLALLSGVVLLRVKPGLPFPFGPYPVIAAMGWLLIVR
ncbi:MULTISPECIES: A24 family peptidase [unclassified Pantoea]|uniref:prepilin peptidase n=1 Tax=unclassified Pantoea TaxID=2630326 RepID=UPI0015D08227|nr:MULTISPECIES: A24 family peptidase [unclassified Pantoea]NYS30060.1 prepilin peptidase [Pantoea sp. WMus005]